MLINTNFILIFFIYVQLLPLPTTKVNEAIQISARGDPMRRIVLFRDQIKVYTTDADENILLIKSEVKDRSGSYYYITVSKKTLCHLTDNSADLCRKDSNRSKEWEFIPQKNRGYMIRSRTNNFKNDRMCLTRSENNRDLLMEKCDSYREGQHWDVGKEDDTGLTGYEIPENSYKDYTSKGDKMMTH